MNTSPPSDVTLLSHCLRNSLDSIVITDRSGIITFVNTTFLEITGYKEDEIIGKSSQVLKSLMTPQDVYKQIEKALFSGTVWVGELCSTKKMESIFGSVPQFLVTKTKMVILKILSIVPMIFQKKRTSRSG